MGKSKEGYTSKAEVLTTTCMYALGCVKDNLFCATFNKTNMFSCLNNVSGLVGLSQAAGVDGLIPVFFL